MFFISGYGIFRNFGIWDIGIYFGIRVKSILGYGIYWTVYFGIWNIAYHPPPPHLTKPHISMSKMKSDSTTGRKYICEMSSSECYVCIQFYKHFFPHFKI